MSAGLGLEGSGCRRLKVWRHLIRWRVCPVAAAISCGEAGASAGRRTVVEGHLGAHGAVQARLMLAHALQLMVAAVQSAEGGAAACPVREAGIWDDCVHARPRRADVQIVSRGGRAWQLGGSTWFTDCPCCKATRRPRGQAGVWARGTLPSGHGVAGRKSGVSRSIWPHSCRWASFREPIGALRVTWLIAWGALWPSLLGPWRQMRYRVNHTASWLTFCTLAITSLLGLPQRAQATSLSVNHCLQASCKTYLQIDAPVPFSQASGSLQLAKGSVVAGGQLV